MKLKQKKIQLNKKDINERNYRILLVTLIAVLIIYICSIPVSIIVEDYKVMFIPYLIVIGVLSFILSLIWLFRKVFKKHVLFFSYFLLTVFYLYLSFSSIVLQPDMVCITILFFLFLNPVIILDYEWRIDLFTAMNSVVYMLLVLVFKNNDTKVHEIFNVLSTLSLCLFLSHFSNKMMIDNIDLKRIAEEAAKTDYLTGLRNRIELFDVLKKENSITGVLMLDIDFFKAYNDTYSHQMGDECLKAVANVLSDITKTYNDIRFYRYGGEEFVGIVKNGFNEVSIYDIAQRIRNNVWDLNIEHIKSNHNRVTVSIGYTIVKEQEEFDYKVMLSQADSALYKAKNNGRNKVEEYIKEEE